MARSFLAALLALALSPAITHAQWDRFRGPNGSGVSAQAVATEWDSQKNVRWTLDLPGAGASSPIVVGDRVVVTCYSGYGLRQEDPGEQADLRRHVVCANAADGRRMWTKTFEPYLPEDPYTGIGIPQHGYASHTPTSDGERIYAFFGKSGVYALDMDGNQLWHTSVGTESGSRGWGTSSSLLLYKNLLIVPATAESQALVALDKLTGREVWRQEASGFEGVWGSPVLVNSPEGRTDVVMAVPGEIWGFDPQSGDLLWYCQGPATSYMCSSAIAHDGVVYAIEQGRGGGGGVAVKAGGTGDVTDTHILWQGQQASRIDTPVLFQDRIYSFTNRVANQYDAKTGEQLERFRLQSPGSAAQERGPSRRGAGMGGQDYSSPIVAGGKLYFITRNGQCFVLGTGKAFKQLAVNRVNEQPEDFSASPAVGNGSLLLRSDKRLYCVMLP